MKKDIYGEIKRRILFFEYQPGEMLNEKAIATEFGVSRTPVREVFLKLEWDKLVTIMPRAGIMVSKVEFQQLRDVFLIRIPLEGLIGRLAATQITSQQLTDLQNLKAKCAAILETSDREELVKVDLELRNILSQAANNQSLQEVSDHLYYQTQRLWSLIFDRTIFPAIVEAEIDEIDQTIKILSEGDPDKAEEFRRKIIINHMDRVKHFFGFPQNPMRANSL